MIVNGRSSFLALAAFEDKISPSLFTVGAGTVGATLEVGADSSSVVSGLFLTNTVPDPSSLMVAIPSATIESEPVTVSLNVSLLSPPSSLRIDVRTNNLPSLPKVMSPVVPV